MTPVTLQFTKAGSIYVNTCTLTGTHILCHPHRHALVKKHVCTRTRPPDCTETQGTAAVTRDETQPQISKTRFKLSKCNGMWIQDFGSDSSLVIMKWIPIFALQTSLHYLVCSMYTKLCIYVYTYVLHNIHIYTYFYICAYAYINLYIYKYFYIYIKPIPVDGLLHSVF